ncbi:NnrS family protein [Roseovarius sp. SCSIO 43702]|uniref:NnrS family protein n=1 Tax=Roseovarius sp. SCSIO 43702 TaxID=2823043 RepID=UPI001C736EEB|nr:NnrS family protein [Roseovarius sp. SCSIO 43702]QYX56200.1 NnrS family protein [Roseovarius sp. SCSIO 43702]
MTMSSAERMRAWTGPAILGFGFRPFFLFGAVWAVVAMLLWVALLSGLLELPMRFDPVSWHAHEFLFGYLGAIVAGFLLTAVPNWTGRLPIVGWPLGALFCLWVAGRITILVGGLLPLWVSVAVDLSFPLALAAVLVREIVAGKNWRNLMVVGLLGVLTVANLIFHVEAAGGEYAAHGIGLRMGLASAVMMIAVIGGRILPSFTRNWLVRRGDEARPAPPMQRFDKITLILSLAVLALWIALPMERLTAIGLVLMGVLHLVRLLRWQGHRTGAEPLVWVLHVAYAFVPLGALVMGAELLLGAPSQVAAQHFWMGGAIGAMTLAVMTRATLGHSGQPLEAGRGTVLIYLALFGAVLVRVAAGAWPELMTLSGFLWIAAFGGFALLYGPLLLTRREKG